MRSKEIHRWQPTGKTPCGRDIGDDDAAAADVDAVLTNADVIEAIHVVQRAAKQKGLWTNTAYNGFRRLGFDLGVTCGGCRRSSTRVSML